MKTTEFPLNSVATLLGRLWLSNMLVEAFLLNEEKPVEPLNFVLQKGSVAFVVTRGLKPSRLMLESEVETMREVCAKYPGGGEWFEAMKSQATPKLPIL